MFKKTKNKLSNLHQWNFKGYFSLNNSIFEQYCLSLRKLKLTCGKQKLGHTRGRSKIPATSKKEDLTITV